MGTALIPLATDHRIAWWAVIVIFVREFAVGIGLRLALRRRGKALHASPLGKIKTNAQLLAILAATLRPRGDTAAAVIVWLAVALTVLSGLRYLASAMRGTAGEVWT